MPALIRRTAAAGRRHFFYGGSPGVAEALAARFSREVPGFTLAGCWSPPYRPLTSAEDDAVVARNNAARPDYIWVGLGSHKQDYWLAEHRDRLHATALLAVGAAFDFESGRARRAPAWMQRSGCEWIYRLAGEPGRLWRRYMLGGLKFTALAAAEASKRTATRQRRV
jgi:N-acetylglucosaminyldiphosphoundecaprenol N-acetyl-beta-D-mannosaminyltransferase